MKPQSVSATGQFGSRPWCSSYGGSRSLSPLSAQAGCRLGRTTLALDAADRGCLPRSVRASAELCAPSSRGTATWCLVITVSLSECDVELALSAKVLACHDEPHRISRMTEAEPVPRSPPPWVSSLSAHPKYRPRATRAAAQAPFAREVRVGRAQARPDQGTALRFRMPARCRRLASPPGSGSESLAPRASVMRRLAASACPSMQCA